MLDPQTLIQGLEQRGVPRPAAIGLVSNFVVESGLNPGINEIKPVVPGSRGGFGLAQFTGPRRIALEQEAARRGVDVSDPEFQLDFVAQELNTTERRARDALFGVQDPIEAARVASEKFFRPGIVNMDARLNAARRILGQPSQTGGQTVQPQQQEGLLSTRGQAQPQPAQGQQQPQQPRGILGALANPDFLDRLAIGLTGMTLNPNRGVIAASGSALQQRAAERAAEGERSREQATAQQRRQASLEFLRQQGRDDLAQALEAGVISPQDAGRIALTPAERQGRLVTAAQMNEMFPGANLEDGLFNLKPDGTASRVGGGGTSVTVNTGSEVGTIPPGFELITDPDTGARRMTPIPGGPAAREIEEERAGEQRRQETQQGQAQQQSSVISRDVDRLVKMIDRRGLFDLQETGVVGGALGSLGINQEAVDFRNTLASIQSSVAFDRLQQMREASKTGGALGAVSGPELDLLISSLGALQQNTSGPVLKENLLNVKRIMNKIENDPVASEFLRSGDRGAASGGGTSGGFSVTGKVD